MRRSILIYGNRKLEGQEAVSNAKAEIIYRILDNHPDIYQPVNDKKVRSRMNICFRVRDSATEKIFLKALRSGCSGVSKDIGALVLYVLRIITLYLRRASRNLPTTSRNSLNATNESIYTSFAKKEYVNQPCSSFFSELYRKCKKIMAVRALIVARILLLIVISYLPILTSAITIPSNICGEGRDTLSAFLHIHPSCRGTAAHF